MEGMNPIMERCDLMERSNLSSHNGTSARLPVLSTLRPSKKATNDSPLPANALPWALFATLVFYQLSQLYHAAGVQPKSFCPTPGTSRRELGADGTRVQQTPGQGHSLAPALPPRGWAARFYLMKVVFPVEYCPTSSTMGLLSKSASSRAGEWNSWNL